MELNMKISKEVHPFCIICLWSHPRLISGDCFNLIHRDNLAITLRFSKPIPSAISGITLMESDNIIEGNKDLLFSCDYRIWILYN